MNESIPLRPLAGLAAVLSRHDELLARLEDEAHGAVEQLIPELQAFLTTTAATGTIVEDFGDRTKLQAVSDYWANVLRRVGHEVARTRLEPFDPQSLPELDEDACPYVGSEPCRDPEYFFGREADIRDIVDRVARESIVVVRGPSGAGKSSLLYAGVLPNLPSEGRIIVAMRPGVSPFARLAKALGAGIGRELSGRGLRNKPDSIRELLANGPAVVLCIDHFEEMFTLAKDGDRSAFDGLLNAFLDASAENRLILCVDDGLVDSVAQMPRLAERLDAEHAQHAVNPLDSAAIERAIVRPAAQVNLELKQGVVEHLMRDLPRGPSTLPILQFMLRRLWTARDRNRVTLAALQTIGDPCEAFNHDAERRFEALRMAGAGTEEIRRVLLEMVRIDDLFDHHRQCVSIETLRAIDGVDLPTLLPLLTEHGFVRVIDGEFAEIPDEAYVYHWKRLVDWIKKYRQPSRDAREALARAAQAWEANNYSAAGLLRRTEIIEAHRLGRLTELEQRFVSASGEQIERDHAERDRGRRRSIMVLTTLVVALLVTMVAMSIAWRSSNMADEAVVQATLAQAEVIQAEGKAKKAENTAHKRPQSTPRRPRPTPTKPTPRRSRLSERCRLSRKTCRFESRQRSRITINSSRSRKRWLDRWKGTQQPPPRPRSSRRARPVIFGCRLRLTAASRARADH
jgi:hypothetical protein